jgi:chaperonin GroEL
MKEMKGYIDNAFHAAHAALEEGISVSDNVTLLYASAVIDQLNIPCPDRKIGVKIVKHSIEAPLCQLCESTGVKDRLIIQKILN